MAARVNSELLSAAPILDVIPYALLFGDDRAIFGITCEHYWCFVECPHRGIPARFALAEQLGSPQPLQNAGLTPYNRQVAMCHMAGITGVRRAGQMSDGQTD